MSVSLVTPGPARRRRCQPAVPVAQARTPRRVDGCVRRRGRNASIRVGNCACRDFKLQRVPSKKRLKNAILKETVEYAAEEKWIARSLLLSGDSQ